MARKNFRTHHTQNERAGEATYRAEDEVYTGGEGGILKREIQAFHYDHWRIGVCAYIDAYMTHYAQEAKEYERAPEQLYAFLYSGSLVGTFSLE